MDLTAKDGCCETGDCPAAVAIRIIGSELKLSVMHSLMSHGRRFNDLRERSGICQSSLSRTLRELEEIGLADRVVLVGERPVAVEYRLTPMGEDLSRALQAFERWTERWMSELEPMMTVRSKSRRAR